jgi:polypeptide N-acetylgalactosaminyltransferase
MALITKQGKKLRSFNRSSILNHFNLQRNNKRVAEIWLDDYKQYFYERHSERYESLEIGDISKQLALKEKLSCRPFHYFFDKIAPDMLERFPLIEPEHFASGTVCYSNKFHFNF